MREARFYSVMQAQAVQSALCTQRDSGVAFVGNDVLNAACIFSGGFLADAHVFKELCQHLVPVVNAFGDGPPFVSQCDGLSLSNSI